MTSGLDFSPAEAFVRSLDGEFFMLREAAEMVGVSQYTLRTLIAAEADGLTPSNYAMFGKVKIYLYTRADIERLREHFKRRLEVRKFDGPAPKSGRPPIYTKDERRERNRLHSQAYYYRKRAEKLMAQGREVDADQALQKAENIERKLKEPWPIPSR